MGWTFGFQEIMETSVHWDEMNWDVWLDSVKNLCQYILQYTFGAPAISDVVWDWLT